MRAVIRLWKSQPHRAAIHKNSLVPFLDVVVDKVVAKSGSQVVSQSTNAAIEEFEYSNKSLDNKICAI